MINSTAWIVSGSSETCALIWSKSQEEAIKLALQEAWFEYDEVKDLTVCREQSADGKRNNNYVICDCPNKEDSEILRNLGWYEIEGSLATCETCEHYEWEDVPDSSLTYENENDEKYQEGGVCKGCQILKKGKGNERENV
jgi:hypothetical protein